VSSGDGKERNVELTIDGHMVKAEPGTTILQAARSAGIDIPTLCQDDRLEPFAACRLCLVEVEGARGPVASCAAEAADGMVVRTETDEIVEQRRVLLDLLLSDHKADCLTCDRAGDCRLQDLAYRYGVDTSSYAGEKREYPVREDTPFIVFDPSKCILCGRCVGICDEVQQCHVLNFAERGFPAFISTSYGRSMVETTCEMCGNCVSACPTGALQDKRSRRTVRAWDVEKVDTVCPYCGCGCNLTLHVADGKVVRVTSRVGEGPGGGNLCVKGRYGFEFIAHPDRLTRPLVRVDGKLTPASWDEALELITSKLFDIRHEHGPDAIAGFASARCTNEEDYVFQKFMRAVIGTNNVDHCARLCHASTVTGLAQSFGSAAMTNSFADLETADAFLIIGSNTSESHPIGALHVKKALRDGARLIVADPREIDMARRADIHLRLRPGTNVALLNGLAHVIIEEGMADDEFIAARTEGFEEMQAAVRPYTPALVEEITGVPADKIVAAARILGTAERAAILYSMGITQHSHGTEHVLAISNLAMLTGNVGRPGTGVNPLRGQNNVQGCCDMGALPNVLPGYQPVTDPALRARWEEAWGVTLPGDVGLTVTETFDAIHEGTVKALIVMGENVMLSDPDQTHVEEALRKLDFLVVQDIFLTETADFADVVLPAACFAEKDGTFTNTERRVQLLRKAVEAPGEAREDWWTWCELAHRMGHAEKKWHCTTQAEIMDEIALLTPSYGGISHRRLDKEGGLAWPVPDAEHPGTPILHTERFARGKGRFFGVEYKVAAEVPDAEYPLTLTTGRMLEHYHTGTMTRRVEGINELVPTGFVEISPADAERLGLADGSPVAVETRRGRIETPAWVTDRVGEGVVFIPFHFWEGPANRLTNPARDPQAKIPEFKVCACKVSPVVGS
jgi:formate dehydrogenase alpha subunit